MGEYTVTDPELVKKREVDDNGRIYVGREYSGRRFRVILEELEE